MQQTCSGRQRSWRSCNRKMPLPQRITTGNAPAGTTRAVVRPSATRQWAAQAPHGAPIRPAPGHRSAPGRRAHDRQARANHSVHRFRESRLTQWQDHSRNAPSRKLDQSSSPRRRPSPALTSARTARGGTARHAGPKRPACRPAARRQTARRAWVNGTYGPGRTAPRS